MLYGRDESWFQTIVAFDRCESERSSSGIRLSASGNFSLAERPATLVAAVSCVWPTRFQELGILNVSFEQWVIDFVWEMESFISLSTEPELTAWKNYSTLTVLF